jgi:hypothetical protein
MSKRSGAREHHRHSVFVADFGRFIVADAAAGLDQGGWRHA